MEKTISLSYQEYKDLKSYCNLNGLIEDDVVKKSYLQGFRIEMYGLLSSGTTVEEKIVEVIKEVPVEIIKEVKVVEYIDREVVKEVPVEKIVNIKDDSKIEELLSKIQQLEERQPDKIEVVKEVVVEKIVNDDKKISMLTDTLQKLKLDISDKNKKIQELEDIVSECQKSKQNIGATYLRGSNLDETLFK